MSEAERVHIIIGDIPFRGEAVEAKGLPDGFGCVHLLETIGDPDIITNDHATTYFAEGTLAIVRWMEDRHPVTGRRQGRPADPRELRNRLGTH